MSGVDLKSLSPAQVVEGAAIAAADDVYPMPGVVRNERAEAIAQALARETGDEGAHSLAAKRAASIADDLCLGN